MSGREARANAGDPRKRAILLGRATCPLRKLRRPAFSSVCAEPCSR
ncbi:Hypothetical protein A7982_11195 [Minicystis rosea]|nr:Hypothetical protein A7982_11195 [Minicystis rosea]